MKHDSRQFIRFVCSSEKKKNYGLKMEWKQFHNSLGYEGFFFLSAIFFQRPSYCGLIFMSCNKIQLEFERFHSNLKLE